MEKITLYKAFDCSLFDSFEEYRDYEKSKLNGIALFDEFAQEIEFNLTNLGTAFYILIRDEKSFGVFCELIHNFHANDDYPYEDIDGPGLWKYFYNLDCFIDVEEYIRATEEEIALLKSIKNKICAMN